MKKNIYKMGSENLELFNQHELTNIFIELSWNRVGWEEKKLKQGNHDKCSSSTSNLLDKKKKINEDKCPPLWRHYAQYNVYYNYLLLLYTLNFSCGKGNSRLYWNSKAARWFKVCCGTSFTSNSVIQ